eukprot:CAMPEP_0172321468 /NCGR_PEP_ID=MMETSP1058-20130122/43510_1 /TAXON_ID=83371 /ORGANISM="Detonula confervacea, Strain CCMP 353" /LENGTH=349 /DNA_ID=CAMNT_0013036987 /DNA_START=151 /DNA_END=1197 /DNA_ORIENTATION=-
MTFPPMPLLPITSPETIEKCKSLPLRPSDVFICSYPKSGTTWTQHIVLSLILADRRHRSQKDGKQQHQQEQHEGNIDYDHVSDFAPFFEIDAHWEPNDNSLSESVRRNHDRLEQRIFNTHLRWEMLPKQQEGKQQNNSHESAAGESPSGKEQQQLRPACGKFIYVTRNLPDVCASFYHHLSNQKEGTYTQGFEAFARDWMAGKIPFGSPLHHLISFARGFSDNQYYAVEGDTTTQLPEAHTDQQQQPLLLLSYEKMKENLREEVLRIIDFLNLDNISIEVLDEEILPTFDFQSMKENAHRFQPKSVTWLNGYQFLRKGIAGDGKKMMMETTTHDEDGEIIPLMKLYRDW